MEQQVNLYFYVFTPTLHDVHNVNTCKAGRICPSAFMFYLEKCGVNFNYILLQCMT